MGGGNKMNKSHVLIIDTGGLSEKPSLSILASIIK